MTRDTDVSSICLRAWREAVDAISYCTHMVIRYMEGTSRPSWYGSQNRHEPLSRGKKEIIVCVPSSLSTRPQDELGQANHNY
jgi:hypothetical protein